MNFRKKIQLIMVDMLPALVLDGEVAPRVLSLAHNHRLDTSYAATLQAHFVKRGCVVIDVDAYTDPVASAMPLLTATEIWHNVRFELLRHLLHQVAQLTTPVVFLNLRAGNESDYIQRMLPGSIIRTFYVLTSVEDDLPTVPVAIIDLTQIFPHVLDSLI